LAEVLTLLPRTMRLRLERDYIVYLDQTSAEVSEGGEVVFAVLADTPPPPSAPSP
jgi:hypothetical protein